MLNHVQISSQFTRVRNMLCSQEQNKAQTSNQTKYLSQITYCHVNLQIINAMIVHDFLMEPQEGHVDQPANEDSNAKVARVDT